MPAFFVAGAEDNLGFSLDPRELKTRVKVLQLREGQSKKKQQNPFSLKQETTEPFLKIL